MKTAIRQITEAEARGKRLRSARMLTNLSRQKLAEKYQISPHTMREWEIATQTGLTKKGGLRFIQALKQEGIFCTIEWLMDGMGPGPRLIRDLKNIKEEASQGFEWQDEKILKEIQMFRDNNPNAVTMLLTDDGMEPFFKAGSYVGGIKKDKNEIEKYIGCFCIVEFTNKITLFRRLIKGKKPNTFTTHCLNPFTFIDDPTIHNAEVESVAQMVWYRAKESIRTIKNEKKIQSENNFLFDMESLE